MRFASRAPADSRVCIVFSSLLWDLGRRVEYHPHQSVAAWTNEWATNYTAVVESLAKGLELLDSLQPHRPKSQLALATAYDVPTRWKFFEAHGNATLAMADAAAAHVRYTARRRGLALVDWQRSFREAAQPESLTDGFGHPSVGAGVALAWSELGKVLEI